MEFDAARHVRYFQRCYKSVLPHHYTGNDSNRLSVGYFIVAGLDILSSPSSYSSPPDTKSAPASLIPAKDRLQIRGWILSLQHRSGGFCGSPQHVFPLEIRTGYNAEKRVAVSDDTENANIAATFFALMLLAIVAEESEEGRKNIYGDVNRIATLKWLKNLQRDDGSFGEMVKADGTIGGGRDMRYAYMASVIRWVLGGNKGDGSLDFNVDRLVSHIRRSQSFDGGMAESAGGEGHAGYSYCAVAALSVLDLAAEDTSHPNRYMEAGITDVSSLIHYLVSLQFVYTGDEEDEDTSEANADQAPPPDMSTFTSDAWSVAGFSGRPNKIADTCYAWWVAGALSLLSSAFNGPTVARTAGREFLIQKTQHVIGGFGNHAGKPPDVYHSYLGLATLATLAGEATEPGLGYLDVRLCIGREAAARVFHGRKEVIEKLPQAQD
jgi:geranylgeranyl transferase type-1 subunit beta